MSNALNALSGEMLKMWFEDKPCVLPPMWISYWTVDDKQIGPRDKLDQSKVKIKEARLQKVFGPWKADIVLSPSESDRSRVSSIVIYDAEEEGRVLTYWHFWDNVFDLKAGEAATVWNPIG